MECFSMKHEIRQNHAEHENGNWSSQNHAEHEIRQNRAEHENGNCSSQNHADSSDLRQGSPH